MSTHSRPRRLEAELALDRGNDFAEGPVWDAERQALLWIDMFAGAVESWDPVSGERDRTEHRRIVTAVAPRAGGGQLIASGHDLLLLDAGGAVEQTAATVETDLLRNRFNDCRVDPQGRLWAGTMSTAGERGGSSVYRLDAELQLTRQIEGTSISNGIGWDLAGEWMYFVDSPRQRLDAFEFDADTGTLGERRTVAEISPDDGYPDGLAVDAEGGIWVALFRGGVVHRYSPTGELDAVLQLPVPNITCPAFGGAGLETLYVTTARYSASSADGDERPGAGSLFALDVGVAGVAAPPFGG